MTTTYNTTFTKGMNTRPAPNVNDSPNGAVAFGVTVEVSEVWKASADGVNVRAGDEWARLNAIPQWVAVKHMGVVYGVLTDTGTTPPPVQSYPESVVWEYVEAGQVKRIQYKFEKEL